MNKEEIHHRLKRLRQRKNLTAKEMAKLIGVPQSTYLDWENGRGMKLPPFQKMSQVLAISVTELLIDEKPPLQDVSEALLKIEETARDIRSRLSSLS